MKTPHYKPTARCQHCTREAASSEIVTRTERLLLCERCRQDWYAKRFPFQKQGAVA